jgi:hypothetical protein
VVEQAIEDRRGDHIVARDTRSSWSRIDRAVLRRELERDRPTYLYLLLSTLSVFASFS